MILENIPEIKGIYKKKKLPFFNPVDIVNKLSVFIKLIFFLIWINSG